MWVFVDEIFFGVNMILNKICYIVWEFEIFQKLFFDDFVSLSFNVFYVRKSFVEIDQMINVVKENF